MSRPIREEGSRRKRNQGTPPSPSPPFLSHLLLLEIDYLSHFLSSRSLFSILLLLLLLPPLYPFLTPIFPHPSFFTAPFQSLSSLLFPYPIICFCYFLIVCEQVGIFGGKRDKTDSLPLLTAARELSEETAGLITVSSALRLLLSSEKGNEKEKEEEEEKEGTVSSMCILNGYYLYVVCVTADSFPKIMEKYRPLSKTVEGAEATFLSWIPYDDLLKAKENVEEKKEEKERVDAKVFRYTRQEFETVSVPFSGLLKKTIRNAAFLNAVKTTSEVRKEISEEEKKRKEKSGGGALRKSAPYVSEEEEKAVEVVVEDQRRETKEKVKEKGKEKEKGKGEGKFTLDMLESSSEEDEEWEKEVKKEKEEAKRKKTGPLKGEEILDDS